VKRVLLIVLLVHESCAKGASSGSVRIDGNDKLRFVPDHLTMTAGKHHFVFSNVGQLRHEFRIVGVYTTGTVAGGSSGAFDATLSAGTYQFVCRIDDHDKSGMIGTLTVS
jgi:uncharacterized cupredoxin-like copper-binding protein